MQVEQSEGRLLLKREPDRKQPFLTRLEHVEQRVRRLRTMIEDDHGGLDFLKEAGATTAALRDVARLCLEDHVLAGVQHVATAGGTSSRREAQVTELAKLIRSVLKH